MTPWTPPLISWTPKGLYCAEGDFHIDPQRAVSTAILTHAHSDHARKGSRRYFCAETSVGLVKIRLGRAIEIKGVPYRERIHFGHVGSAGQVAVSFHPAGHILGSAQIRIQRGSEVWVVSGDYKRERDPSCEPFEPVRCDTFVTEATFGTPKYSWKKDLEHGSAIHAWWQENAKANRNSILFGYSIGKAQRILAELAPYAERPVLIHESIEEPSRCYREQGYVLAQTRQLASLAAAEKLRGELVLAPPSILKTEWFDRFGDFQTAFASGWMHGSSHGFVMSDHADWSDLNRTIDETGASRVFVLHRDGALIRHLRQRGLDAHPAAALVPEAYHRIEPVNLSLF